MKRMFVLLALILIVATALWLGYSDRPRPVEVGDLPWQVEALPDGTSRVFGVVLGQSSLKQVSQTFETLPELALFEEADDSLRLEAYFGRLRLGVLEARVVAHVAVAPEELAGIRERSPSSEPMPSGARKLGLTEDDIAAVYEMPVDALTYIPSAQYDEAIVRQRFGEPAEILPLNDTQRYWLYPAKGLALLLGEEEREVLEYVPPRDFEAVRARLTQAAADRSGAE